jgi:heterogeneous nuclear ribonucleoprotein A1/A3
LEQGISAMALASRLGSVLRRTSASSNSSLLQAIRCMSSSKLFVGGMFRWITGSSSGYCILSILVNYLITSLAYLLVGLSYNTDDPTLRGAFSVYGDVIEGCLPNYS